MERELAVINRAKFGVGDRGRCWLQFEAKVLGGSAALQVLDVDEAARLLEQLKVSDVRTLDGRTIVVEKGDSTITYVEGWAS